MKKIAIFGLTVILLNTVHAQFATSSLMLDASAIHSNAKAVKSFVAKYENATNVRWSRLQDGGLLVHFYNDGIQTKIFYNRKGHETARIRYYSEGELPNDVKHQVKSTYYEYAIFLIIEVTVGNKTAYLVKIENKLGTKTIRVMNGEMEVVEELDKL